MATVSELLERNKTFATTHQPIPTLAELGEMGADHPHTIVITCADPRCHPENFLSISMMDGIIIIRNAGGHVENAINDILALDSFVGITDILVIHHTDCGTLHFKDPVIREDLKSRFPEKKSEIDGMVFGSIDDLEQSVKDDLQILKASPFIRKELADRSVGFMLDLKTGALTAVSA